MEPEARERKPYPLVGQTLGPYELRAGLGAGGMGAVYRGYHRRLDRNAAIKILPANLAADHEFVERFEREARHAAALRHPYIVVIYDVNENNGIHYIAMELLEGRPLSDLIRQRNPLPIPLVLSLLDQLAEAIDFAHSRKVAHRDIKPSNVFVGPNDHLTLVDFGIARTAGESRLTATGKVNGTAEYLAPELAQGGQDAFSGDLYALGIVTYEMLVGHCPFTGQPLQILYAQVHTPPPSLKLVRDDLPAGLEHIILRQLAKDPAARYQTAKEFVSALRRAEKRGRQLELAQAALASGSLDQAEMLAQELLAKLRLKPTRGGSWPSIPG